MSLPILFFIVIALGAISGLMAGLLGIGGGTIIVPALLGLFSEVMSEDKAMQMALGTTIAVMLLTMAGASVSHIRLGNVTLPIVQRYAPWMMLGAFAGSQIAGRINGEWLTWIFSLFLLYMAVRISEIFPRPVESTQKFLTFWQQRVYAFVFGVLAIFFGLAGGILLVPHLLRHHHLSMQQSIGTATSCGIFTALVGTVGYMLYAPPTHDLPLGSIGFVYWPAALIIGLTGFLAAPLGVLLSKRLPVLLLKRIFAGVLVLIALNIFLN